MLRVRHVLRVDLHPHFDVGNSLDELILFEMVILDAGLNAGDPRDGKRTFSRGQPPTVRR